MKFRDWISQQLGATVTQGAMAERMEVGIATIKRRESGRYPPFSAEEIIHGARLWKLNPVTALMDLGFVEFHEVVSSTERDGKTIGELGDGELALELAQRLNPALRLIDHTEIRTLGDTIRASIQSRTKQQQEPPDLSQIPDAQ